MKEVTVEELRQIARQSGPQQHQDLTVATISPKIVLKEAIEAARSLKSLLAKKAKPVIINNQQYLQFEDWSTLGQFFKITARVTSTNYVSRNIKNEIIWGFEATADAVHIPTGAIISSATAECMSDEPNWKDKPSFQLRSMAQTRACAKALRNCLSWVAVLAGYQPTPAEEVMTESPKEIPVKTQPITTHDYDIKSVRDLYTACWKEFGLQPKQVLQHLGVNNSIEIADPAASWQKIKEIMQS
jgi:hypothetical protein